MRKSISSRQGKDLQIMALSVDFIFKKLQIKSGRDISFEEEQLWKKLFDEKVLVALDDFLAELSSEANINYDSPVLIKDLKKHL